MMKHGKIRNSGFTLLETLIVVAVLVILLGLSMVGVARWRDHLKLTELDNATRDIYMAAENRAVLLQNSGAAVKLLSAGGLPSFDLTEGSETKKVCVLSSKAPASADQLKDLVPPGSIDPALRDGEGQFVVLYDESTRHVREVFYAEKKLTTDNPITDDSLKNFRKSRPERVSDYRSGQRSIWWAITPATQRGSAPSPGPPLAWRLSSTTAMS